MKEDETIQEVEEVEIVDQNIEETEQLEELEDTAEEITDSADEYEYVRQTKPIGKLITLVAVTAIMLVSSTYAWFSTQKNVTISSLKGEVNVAEGLQMSLDAKHWLNTINFEHFNQPTDGSGWTVKDDSPTTYLDEGATFQEPAEGITNIVPTDYKPVSTTGRTNEGIGKTSLTMYNGIYTDTEGLKSIGVAPEEASSGYYAFDLYLLNTSAEEKTKDVIKLDANSVVIGTNSVAGIQNTVRVGIALYENNNAQAGFDEATATAGTNMKIDGANPLTAEQIIAGTSTGKNISDVAIWEPNADAHVPQIINSTANTIKFSEADRTKYTYLGTSYNSLTGISRFADGEVLPTYGITADSAAEPSTIQDVYDWATPGRGLKKQYTLQTNANETRTEVIDLLSIKKLEANENATDKSFEIVANQYQKVRVYVWIEGQDPDCITYASLGGGLTVSLGITKEDSVIAELPLPSTTETTPYLPTGFSYDGTTTLSNGLTIEDGLGNEYVWVEVPRNETIYADAGLDIELDDLTGTELTNAYTAIETDLHDYTGTGYTDVHSGDNTTTGLTSTQYTNLKHKMLKSVYENGGFYIGKYETGTLGTYRDYGEDFMTEHPIAETAVVQANAYPYGFVTAAQAQSLATGMSSGNRTSSLIFGIQWDLTLKYLESKGVSSTLLYDNSTTWGNYTNNTFSIADEDVSYNELNPDSGALGEWFAATEYTHDENDIALLTTGARSAFSKQGIYDLAGNAAEWTLEYSSDASSPCVFRGGSCFDNGLFPASFSSGLSTGYSDGGIGFRVALY